MYRGAKSSLGVRIRKKLMEKVSWYKKRKREDENNKKVENPNRERKMNCTDKIREKKAEPGDEPVKAICSPSLPPTVSWQRD